MTKERKRKRIILAAVSIVMVLCLIVIGTLAWLQYRTDEAVNTFVLGSGVKIDLVEEKYNDEFNIKRKNEFTPGMELDKDPTVIVPENASIQEYIAVTVRYYVEQADHVNKRITLKEISYNDFKQKYAQIYSFCDLQTSADFLPATVSSGSISYVDESKYQIKPGIRDGWIATDDYRIFYYGTMDSPNNSTMVSSGAAITLKKVSSGAAITLFDKVVINDPYDQRYNSDTANYTFSMENYPEEMIASPVTSGQLMGFHIDVCAYAVQGNIDSATGKVVLDGLINEHIGNSS